MTLLVTGAVLAVLIIGVLVGVVAGHIVTLPADRRRLELMTQQMLAELRVEHVTRSTIQAMRDATRRQA